MAAHHDTNFDPHLFMECVMAAVGVQSVHQLIDVLGREGVLDPSQQRSLYRWNTGTGPNFQSTMRLLRRAGFLTAEALACLDTR